MDIPIIGNSDLGPYPINMFYSQAAHKGLNLPGLMGTPGLKEYYDPSHSFPVRGLKVMGSSLYAVIGNRVYQINTTPIGTLLTGTLTGTTKPVCMEQDGTYLMIVEPGVEGYTYTAGGEVTAIADADFPTPSFLAWQDGYFIPLKADSGRFYIPTLYDPTAWDALDYATAEATPDNALANISDHSEVLIFGSESIQPYYNSGNADFPFDPIQGSTIQEGLGAAHSVAAGDNTVFFLDVHGRVMRISGHSANPISSRDIEKEITGFSIFSDAIGFYYAHKGHGFYVLTFPKGNATWVFDVSTQQWHKRKSYPVHPNGTEGRWRASCHALFNGKHIVGDYANGKLYELDFDVYTDNSETIRRVFDFPAVGDGKTKIRHNKLKLDYKTGVGINPTANLVTNEGFDSDTAWTKETGWSITGGKAVCSGAQLDSTQLYQDDIVASVGSVFEVTFTVSDYSAGGVSAYVGNTSGTIRVANGTYTQNIRGTITANWFGIVGNVDFIGKIDNVRVRLQPVDVGVDPQAMLLWSDDGKKTWSNELTASMGKIGEYDKEVNFSRLASSSRRIYRNIVSDPVEVVITGAKLT